MATLVDSGDRTTFNGGAMREITEEKGRCDLLPLIQLGKIYARDITLVSNIQASKIFELFDGYIQTGDQDYLYAVVKHFIDWNYQQSFSTAFLELAKHYADGAKKYEDRNWEKGLPLHSFIDSAIRHYFKFLRGDKDEPHDRAFLWNTLGAIWTQDNHPECVDLPFNETKITNDNAKMSTKVSRRIKSEFCIGCRFNTWDGCMSPQRCFKDSNGFKTGYEQEPEDTIKHRTQKSLAKEARRSVDVASLTRGML